MIISQYDSKMRPLRKVNFIGHKEFCRTSNFVGFGYCKDAQKLSAQISANAQRVNVHSFFV